MYREKIKVLLVAAWVWSGRIGLPYRWTAMVLLSVSPMLLHGFALGRPDHQSLAILLVGMGLMAEAARWIKPSRGTAVFSGALWGLAVWVSWFEPAAIWAMAFLYRIGWLLLSRPRRPLFPDWAAEVFLPGAVTAAIAAAVVVFEGPPEAGLSAGMQEIFWRWAGSIGEMQRASPLAWCPLWLGWLGLALPFALAWRWVRSREPLSGFWLILLLLLGALTSWHMRWGYFFVLAGALSLPLGLDLIRSRPAGWLLFLAGLWPLAGELERTVFPEGRRLEHLTWMEREGADLLQAAHAMRAMDGEGILAPWWMTPQLVYWSGKRGVAGSSHESLPGTVDAARFFLAENPGEARKILEERKVSFVVAGAADRVLETSSQILDRPAPEKGKSMIEILDRTPSFAPGFLTLVFRNGSCKVYRFEHERF